MEYKEMLERVSDATGFSKTLINKTYKAYWKAVKEYISSLPLKEDLTDEEFNKLKPNVNIPSIGKLYVTLDRYHKMKKSQEVLKELTLNKRKRNGTTHQED